MIQKNRFLLFFAVGAFALGALETSGCKKTPAKGAEISKVARLQAANFVSEAQFAVTLKDYARAEGVLAQAVAACPDTPEYWLALGQVRDSGGRKDEAKDAYKHALAVYADLGEREPTNPEPRFNQIYTLVQLGRADEARAAQAKMEKQFAMDPRVRAFVQEKQLENILAEHGVK